MFPKNIIPANQILPVTDYEDSRTGWTVPGPEQATSIRRRDTFTFDDTRLIVIVTTTANGSLKTSAPMQSRSGLQNALRPCR